MDVPFSLQIKPVGSRCNIRCHYCYVMPFRKEGLVRMSEEVLEKTLRQCFQGNPHPTITWHGGEPLLAGIAFYQMAVRLIQRYSQECESVVNLVQTNATLMTPEMAQLFADNDFRVGVSIDGPKLLHGIHRVDSSGKNTFDRVKFGVSHMISAGLSPWVTCTVTPETLQYPKEVFRFLVEMGFKNIKYNPVYDSPYDQFSIQPEQWLEYLRQVFCEWFELGDESIEVREFDEVISWLDDCQSSLCRGTEGCLSWVSVDPSGDLYPCEYLRSYHGYGNIREMNFSEIPLTSAYQSFRAHFSSKPEQCQECSFFKQCGNGCPATRVKDGQMAHDGLYVYCQEKRGLFEHIRREFEEALSES